MADKTWLRSHRIIAASRHLELRSAPSAVLPGEPRARPRGLVAATVPPCPACWPSRASWRGWAGVPGERNAAAAGFVWARREVVVCWKPRVEKGFVRTVAQQQAAGITGRSPPALAAHAAQHPAPLAPSPVFVCVFLSFQRPSDPAKSPTPHPPTLTVERTASTSPTATPSLFVPPTAPNLTTNRPQPSTDPRPLPQIARIPKQITGTHVTRPLSASKSIERTKQCIQS